MPSKVIPSIPTTPAPPRIAAGAYPMCSSPVITNGCAAGASTAAASGVGLIMGALSYYSRPRATVLRSPLVDKAADWIYRVGGCQTSRSAIT